MPKNPSGPFWFIREDGKFIQCSKAAFDQAIVDGRSIKYNGYPNRKAEKIAEALEASRMLFLSKPDLAPKFRLLLTNPVSVVEVEVIEVNDPEFWIKASKNPKYQK